MEKGISTTQRDEESEGASNWRCYLFGSELEEEKKKKDACRLGTSSAIIYEDDQTEDVNQKVTVKRRYFTG